MIGRKVWTAVETGTTTVAAQRWNAVMFVMVATTPLATTDDRAQASALRSCPVLMLSPTSFVATFVAAKPQPQATTVTIPVSIRRPAHRERDDTGEREHGDDPDHVGPAPVRLGVVGCTPGDERDSADDRAHAEDVFQPDVLVEDVRPEHEHEQQPDRERGLDDHERRPAVGDDLRPDADDAKQPADDPDGAAKEPSQKRQAQTERAGRHPGVDRLQDDPDVEEHRSG